LARSPDRSSDPNIRALSQPLLDASPRQLLRVVGVVDALVERGAMDELVAMVRPRLGRLRPPRPLRYPRLLFTPLDPVIVPPARWRAEDATVPTSAIPPIAATLRAARPELVAEIDLMITDHTSRDDGIVATAGARLWPEAAQCLLAVPQPIGWDACGLNISVYPALARRVGAILLSAVTIHAMVAADAGGAPAPTEAELAAVPRQTMEADPDSLRTLLIIMLQRLPDHADAIVSITTRAGANDGVGKRALDEAADVIMIEIERTDAVATQIVQAALTDAAANARRMTRVLQALDRDRAPASRREMLRAARAKLDQGCRSRFSDGLMHEFLTPFDAMSRGNSAVNLSALEDVARQLRALETEARGLGGGGMYDKLLAQSAEALRSAAPGPMIGVLDRARLVEIIADPDLAMGMVDEFSGKEISEFTDKSNDH
jgi:hypothetical protein